jgi:hypothetical protein
LRFGNNISLVLYIMEALLSALLGISVVYMCTGMLMLNVNNIGSYAVINAIAKDPDGMCTASVTFCDIDGLFQNSVITVPCSYDLMVYFNAKVLPITYSIMNKDNVVVGYPVLDLVHASRLFYNGIIALLVFNECLTVLEEKIHLKQI